MSQRECCIGCFASYCRDYTKKERTKIIMPLKKVLGPDIPENPPFFVLFFLVFLEVFGVLVALVADKSFRNQKPKKIRGKPKKKNKKNNASEQSPWPRHSLESFGFFGFFCFPQGFLVFGGPSSREKLPEPKTKKKLEENQKQHIKQCL